jgi:hypothetical protein
MIRNSSDLGRAAVDELLVHLPGTTAVPDAGDHGPRSAGFQSLMTASE